MESLFGKPTYLLADPSIARERNPPQPHFNNPPSFAKFSFETIGKDPELLKRISAPNPDQEYYPEPDRLSLSRSLSPNLEDQLLPSEYSPEGGAESEPLQQRLSLLQSLTGGNNVEMVSATESDSFQTNCPPGMSSAFASTSGAPAIVCSTRPLSERIFGVQAQSSVPSGPMKSTENAPSKVSSTLTEPSSGPSKPIYVPLAALETEESTSISSKVSTPIAPLTPTFKEVPEPQQSMLPLSVDLGARDPSYTTLQALQGRFLSSLSTLGPELNDVIRLAQSAQTQSATVLSSARRAHVSAEEALSHAQSTMQAVLESLNAADEAKNRCEALVSVIKSKGEELICKKQAWENDLHALGEWIKEKEEDTVRYRQLAVDTLEREKSRLEQSRILQSVTGGSRSSSAGSFVIPSETDAATRAWNQQREQAAERRRIAGEELQKRREAEAKVASEQRRAEAEAKAHREQVRKLRQERIEAESAEEEHRKQEQENIQRSERQLENQKPANKSFELRQKEALKLKDTGAQKNNVQEATGLQEPEAGPTLEQERGQRRLQLVEEANLKQQARQPQERAENHKELLQMQDIRRQEIQLEKRRANNEAAQRILAKREREIGHISTYSPQVTSRDLVFRNRHASLEIALAPESSSRVSEEGRTSNEFLNNASPVISGNAILGSENSGLDTMATSIPTTIIPKAESDPVNISPTSTNFLPPSDLRASSSDSERSIPLSQLRPQFSDSKKKSLMSPATLGSGHRRPHLKDGPLLPSIPVHWPPKVFNALGIRPGSDTPLMAHLSPHDAHSDEMDAYISVHRESHYAGNIPVLSNKQTAFLSQEAHRVNLRHVADVEEQPSNQPMGNEEATAEIVLETTSPLISSHVTEVAYKGSPTTTLPPSAVQQIPPKHALPVRLKTAKPPDFTKVRVEAETGRVAQRIEVSPHNEPLTHPTALADAIRQPEISTAPSEDIQIPSTSRGDSSRNHSPHRTGHEPEDHRHLDLLRHDLSSGLHRSVSPYDNRRRDEFYGAPIPSRSYDYYSPSLPLSPPRRSSFSQHEQYPRFGQRPFIPTNTRSMSQRMRSRSRSRDNSPPSMHIIGRKRPRDDGFTSFAPRKHRHDSQWNEPPYFQRYPRVAQSSCHDTEKEWSRASVYDRSPSPVLRSPPRRSRTPPGRAPFSGYTSMRGHTPDPPKEITQPEARPPLASRLLGRLAPGDAERSHNNIPQEINASYRGKSIPNDLPQHPGSSLEPGRNPRGTGNHGKPYGDLNNESNGPSSSHPTLLARFSDYTQVTPMDARSSQHFHRPMRQLGGRGRGTGSQRFEKRVSSKPSLRLMDRIQS